ncbi:probable atrazine chlorohydrolase/guanine deaminase [Phialocephala subalpina]|uniref:Probable atrazine chlorohydrolase/guanine deaminase n=1 Tax=Phialocephala subalpina TaxID=576137 RepID=A0A1L7XF68_9HELO|nr:probable atrazine chlorohydrolase/guanine deaminase [Phialocephala subalpina]
MLYIHATIITVDPGRRIIENGAILVVEDTIKDIGLSTDLLAKYPSSATYDLENHIVIPGLISTHMHVVQSIFRGTADDVDLVSWMCDRIWVMQGNILPEEAYAAARLSIAEMLLGGTTTFLESLWAERYGFDKLVKAVEESGIRGCLGKVVMDVNPDQPAFRTKMHSGLVEGRETLKAAIQMWEKYDGVANDRVKVWFGARTPGGVTTEFLREMCKEAKERNIHITMHCLEERPDREVFESFKMSPMEYCDSIGLLSDRAVLIHMCWVEEREMELLRQTGTHIAHCPASNLKLGSGFCPVPKLLKAGVNVGIGCDGAPCNNTLDLFQEMRLAAWIHKGYNLDPKVVSAEEALEMATINGAKALGLDGTIGSLEVGKKADFVGIKLKRAHQVPNYDPVATIVYSTNAGDVDLVVVNGKVVVKDGKLTTIDEATTMKEGIAAGAAVISRSGLAKVIVPKWPVVRG